MKRAILTMAAALLVAGMARAEPPNTPRAITQPVAPTTQASEIFKLLRTQEIKSAVFVAPTTQPSEPNSYTPLPVSPATQPSSKYDALIRQLGDDNPHVREAAMHDLRKAGRDTAPALKAAATSPDPQVRDSAQILLADMDGSRRAPQSPADALADLQPMPQGHIVLRGGGLVMNNLRLNNIQGQVQFQMQVVRNGQFTRDVNVSENDTRKIHIHEDNDGIKVELSENGKTSEYAAKNADELKEKQPQGYKLYEKYMKNGVAGQLHIQVDPPANRP